MTQAQTSQPGVIALHTDASTLRRCVDLLRSDEASAVQLRLQRAEAQARGYGHLQLLTFAPNGWWEYNGVAVRCEPEADGERSVVVSMTDLSSAMAGASWAFGGAAVRLNWYAGGIQVEGHDVPALAGDEVPPLPDLGVRIDRMVVPAGAFEEIIAETQLGRVRVSEALVSHLVRRGVTSAELCDVNGQPWLEAHAELRSPANTLPVTVAPLELLTVAMTEASSSVPAVPGQQERRRGNGDEVAQLLLVSNPEAPVEHLVRLLDEGIGFVRRRAAAHPNLPREVIDMLLRNGTTSIRAVAATNPAITPESVRRAACDEMPPVRAAAATSPRLPEEDLVRLVADVEPEVRASAGRNEALATSLAEQLAADPDPQVREGIASNLRAPKAVLSRLGRDQDPRVCLAVARNPSTPSDALHELSGALPHFVLGNPSAPRGVLSSGALASDPELRLQVARNTSTPPKALTRLAGDADRRVLNAITKNPGTPKPAAKRAASRLQSLDAELEAQGRQADLANEVLG